VLLSDAVALQEVRAHWAWDGRGQQLMQLLQVVAVVVLMILASTLPTYTHPHLSSAAARLSLLALLSRHVLQRRL
jgi:hypothetical protein